MGSAYNPEMTSWLHEVQRDPRTLGAFRRRIESVLRDPAVARRVSGRLLARQEGDAAECRRAVLSGPRARVRGLAALLDGLQDMATTRGSIIGRCQCTGGCCMMMADLQAAETAPPMLRF